MFTEVETSARMNEAYKKYRAAKKSSLNTAAFSGFLNIPIQQVSEKVGNLACRSGCSHCCYLRVSAYSFEIVSIYFYLVTRLDKDALAAFKERLQEKAISVSSMSVDEHYITNVQCPMLEDNKCIVYPVRPMACAGYHSLSEPTCRDSYEHPEIVGDDGDGIPMALDVKEMQSFQSGIAEAVLNEENDDTGRYELISALYQIFEKPTLLQLWRNGRKMFSNLPD
ncbi:MAG: YkgJ family cysteine cluster protein [Gammaproteobacteria bacterium]|nr:YkgJ family cysteine cluster protein [Gammaproteobacteria bacterium]